MKRTRLNKYTDYSNEQIDNVIDQWIHNIRDRRILHYKLVDGYTFEWIAEKEDMSSQRIRRIVYDSEMVLLKHLGDS